MALGILRSEVYFDVHRNDEGPAGRQEKRSRWPFFSNLLNFTSLFDALQHLLEAGAVKTNHNLFAG